MEGHGRPFMVVEHHWGHWTPLRAMEHHWQPCNTMEGHGIILRAFEGLGTPWKAMDHHWVLWNMMEGQGGPWNTIEGHGTPLGAMEHPWGPLNTIEGHGGPFIARESRLLNFNVNPVLNISESKLSKCWIKCKLHFKKIYNDLIKWSDFEKNYNDLIKCKIFEKNYNDLIKCKLPKSKLRWTGLLSVGSDHHWSNTCNFSICEEIPVKFTGISL